MKNNEEEVVAQLRLALDREEAPVVDVLHGAVLLSAMGYGALAREYAARVLKKRESLGDPSLLETARGLIMTAHLGGEA